ncbi:putative adhesin [Lachnotalea glycerini]|uniref:Putative adhesin n=1 Tax=Lachnotalea glycerini TaxID=1763509 RepID=A0A255IKY1_9FIRM|nr:DUF4097 family beta strand repeat-containing protein [Lachnotalea glycerini]PXV88346.1 putative adhesin [Lachnotalea glycerini]RDY27652.1 hypothetical protein CG710_020415 [Lachnotalea glycerini]
MKSFARACLIFSGVVISIGLILTIIGGILGAGSTFANMVRIGNFSFHLGNDKVVFNDDDLVSFSDEFNNIDELDVDLSYCEFKIVESDNNVFQVKADNVLDGFTCNEKDGKLIIKDNIKMKWSIGFERDYHPTITLYIPENVNMDKVKIDIGAGYVSANHINTDELVIDLGAGEFEGSMITSENADLTVGAGHMLLDEFSTDEINLDCGTGKVEINGDIRGNSDVECGLGNVAMILKQKQSYYNYDIKCGIGNVEVGELSIGGVACDKYIDNNAKNNMDIDCGVGSVQIKFADL